MKAIIVGGGIGGLACAVALHRRGLDVQVLERTDGPAEGGAALSLWPNALRALETLGIARTVREHAVLGGDSGVRRPDGRWLARTNLGPAITARFGDPLVIIGRRRLLDLLRAELPADTVLYNHTVTAATAGTDRERATVTTTGAAYPLDADLVIAADGVRSRVRGALLPTAPDLCYAGYTAWRMIAPAPTELESFETWGTHGRRFAVLPLNNSTCYSYATVTAPENTLFDSDLSELRRLFGDWHPPIPEILAALTDTEVLRNDITELPPLATLNRGRIALLGDAAHAMTPELGQGACLALEDAVDLAASIDPTQPEDVLAALTQYTNTRLPRTTSLTRRSHQASSLYSRGLITRYAAARVMNLLPARLITRGLDPVLNWHHPSTTDRFGIRP